jgi:hypothetical protein
MYVDHKTSNFNFAVSSLLIICEETNSRQDKPPVKLGNYSNLLNPENAWRWEYPNAHQKATVEYDTAEKRRHQDTLGREWEGVPDDRYLSPWDGKVKPLVVQATDDIYKNANSSTYGRTFIRNVSPYMLRIATWPTSESLM